MADAPCFIHSTSEGPRRGNAGGRDVPCLAQWYQTGSASMVEVCVSRTGAPPLALMVQI